MAPEDHGQQPTLAVSTIQADSFSAKITGDGEPSPLAEPEWRSRHSGKSSPLINSPST
jgi:hypothetical protein